LFNVEKFLNSTNGGSHVSNYGNNQKVFSQGDPADAVFYIQEGRVKLSIRSERGKEAVVALHGKGDFFGEGCLTGQPLRLATAATMTDCVITRLEKAAIIRVLHDEPKFSEMFMAHLGKTHYAGTSLHVKAGEVHGPHSTEGGCDVLVLWTNPEVPANAKADDFVLATK
jgi:CRP-like cAMP-binding protein